jgi:nitrogen fixation NifU-like protein
MPSKLAKEELELLRESGYSKKAIQLYMDKVNVGILKNSDIVQTYTGPCGDVIKLYLKIDRNGVIKDAKFHYLGCPGSASSASAMTNLLKGKTIEEAKKLTEDDVLKELGGLPELKLDCPKLVVTTLRKAIARYEKKRTRLEA